MLITHQYFPFSYQRLPTEPYTFNIDHLTWVDTKEEIGYESKFSAQLTFGILFYSELIHKNDVEYLLFIAIR